MRKPTQKNIFSLFSNIFWILVTHISLPTSHIDERCANGISGSGHTRQSSSYKASGLERKGKMHRYDTPHRNTRARVTKLPSSVVRERSQLALRGVPSR